VDFPFLSLSRWDGRSQLFQLIISIRIRENGEIELRENLIHSLPLLDWDKI
jgi:hypothetical protein